MLILLRSVKAASQIQTQDGAQQLQKKTGLSQTL